MEFKTKCFVLWITHPCSFVCFWYWCWNLKASKIVLFFRYFYAQQTIQVSPDFCWRLWVFFFFSSSENLQQDVWNNVVWIVGWVSGKVGWNPGAPPPGPESLTSCKWLHVSLWLPVCVLTQHSAWNNRQEKTKGCFVLFCFVYWGPGCWSWKVGICQADLDRGRVRCKGGWLRLDP